MSLIKVNKNENPYDVIGNYIEKHVSVIDNVIAVISINGEIHNELLLVEITYNNNFVWLNDWWEGEENVELIDFFFVSEACKANNNKDLIDRQQAIDAMFNLCNRLSEPCYRCENPHIDVIVDELEQLPSTQTEIIQCKDCKHWMPYDWMFSEVWQSQNIDDYPEDEIGCKYCDMHMKSSDFCSYAERREVTE